ncbi:MAG: DNA-directed RNA polymerase subunit omega [Candidatus Aminicenantaceae bacterium]
MKKYGDIDSKFRYIILSAKRASMLLKGARPKIKTKSKNMIRIAQEEVRKGLIDYEFIQPSKTESLKTEDEAFIGEEIVREKENGNIDETKSEDEAKDNSIKDDKKKE